MQAPLIIDETVDTPLVEMDSVKGIFRISGRSLPEDAVGFYAPVKKYLQEYIANPNSYVEFVFEMDYYNSASSKQFVIMLFDMEQIMQKGKQIKIIWYYSEDDEVMQDKGEEIKAMTTIPFELKTH